MSIDERLRNELARVQVDAPIDDGLRAVRGRVRRRRTVRVVVAGAVLAIAGTAAGLALGDGDQAVRTRLAGEPGGTELTLPPPPAPLDPALEDGSVRIVEPAPPEAITDGADVVVALPVDVNGNALSIHLCATTSGGEYCDLASTRVVGEEVHAGMTERRVTIEVRRHLSTAVGVIDCRDGTTPCHVRAEFDSDLTQPALRSERLAFTDHIADHPSVELSPDGALAEGDDATIRVTGAHLHESVRAAIQRGDLDPAFGTLTVALCQAQARWTDRCTNLGTIAPDDDGRAELIVRFPRELFSYDGWVDCARQRCIVAAGRTPDWFRAPGGSFTSGYEQLAATLVLVDPAVPAAPRPSLRVVEPEPIADGQVVHVIGEHFPPDFDDLVGLCHDVPGEHYSFCVYPSGVRGHADADGTFEIELRLPRHMLGRGDLGEEPGIDCAEAPGRCYLGIVTGEGMPTMVRTPLTFAS